MIDFRYHVVSLVALFLALAAGIALGAGPLQGDVEGRLAGVSSDSGSASLESDLADAERLGDFQSAYGADTASLVLGGRLDRTSVSMLVLPGADPEVVRDLTKALAAADANLVSTVTVAPDLVDPANRQLAEGLAQQVLDGVDGATGADGATSYTLVGSALGRAFLTHSPDADPQDSSSGSIQAAFEEASMVSVDGVVGGRAQLALVVAGDPRDDAPDGESDVVTDLVAGLDAAVGGTVVAGTLDSASDGALAAVRDSDLTAEVSTVDPVETGTGQAVAVLALADQAAGRVGQYGVDGADGALPDLAQD